LIKLNIDQSGSKFNITAGGGSTSFDDCCVTPVLFVFYYRHLKILKSIYMP